MGYSNKISTVFRLKSLSALIGVALVSGMYSRPANAECTTDSSQNTTCSGSTRLDAPIGGGGDTSGVSVIVDPDAAVIADKTSAISLGDDVTISVGTDAVVQNSATSSDAGGNYHKGNNTIEFNSNGTLTVSEGATVSANGTSGNSEAVNVMGSGNTITNQGTISSLNTAAIWFEDEETGKANVINNYGTISTVTGSDSNPGAVIGNSGNGDVQFNNYAGGVVDGNLAFGLGNDTLSLEAGSSINGTINGGGGTNALTLTGDAGTSDTLTSDLANFQTLTKTGDGAWTVSGALTDNSVGSALAIEVDQGELTLKTDVFDTHSTLSASVKTDATLIGNSDSLAFDIDNGGNVTFDQTNVNAMTSSSGVYQNAISGDGSVTVKGGLLILTGNNSYKGDTTIDDDGRLVVGTSGSPSNLVGNIVNNGSLAFESEVEETYGGDISGSGSVLVAGHKTLTLTGDSDYSGGTAITGGQLQIGDGGDMGSITGNVQDGTMLIFNRSGTLTMDGKITGDGRVQQIGDGITVLTGENDYTGRTTISNGTLQIGDGGNSGSITSDVTNDASLVFNRSDRVVYEGVIEGKGTLTQDGVDIDTGVLVLTGENTYTGGTIIKSGTLQIGDGGEKGSIIGSVANSGALAFDHSDDISFNGAINGTGSVLQNGSGTLTLTGENGYTGGTFINSGILAINNGNALGSSTVTLAGGALSLINSLNFADAIKIQADTGTIVTGEGTASQVSGVISGSGGLNYEGKAGSTLILTGNNSYGGGTTITSGTLQIGAGNTGGSIQGDVANNGTLVFNRSGVQTFSGDISGSGAVVQMGVDPVTGSGYTTILTGNNTYEGGTTIFGGSTLQIGAGEGAGSIIGNVVNDGTLAFDLSSNISLDGVISGTGSVLQKGTGTLTLTGDNTYTGSTSITSGTLAINNSNALGDSTGSVLLAAGALSLLSDVNVAQAITLRGGGKIMTSKDTTSQVSGIISGPVGLNYVGEAGSTLILTGTNSYVGDTMITSGTLQIGDGKELGSITGNVANSGTLAFDHSDDISFGGLINGSGSVVQKGSGTLTLTGENSYTGGTFINSGILAIGKDSALGTSTVTLAGGALSLTSGMTVAQAIDIQQGTTGTIITSDGTTSQVSGEISGPGELNYAGGNGSTLILTGDNSYGSTKISSGTLQIGDGESKGSITGDVVNGGTLIFNRQGDVTFGGDISGSGSVIQSGVTIDLALPYSSVTGTTSAGSSDYTTILTGNNTYSGGTTINSGGTLQLGDGGTKGSITGNVINNGTLVVDRSNAMTLDGTISGQGSLIQAGAGVTKLTADNSYSGGTTIRAGTLSIGKDSALGDTAGAVTLAGGTLALTSNVISDRTIYITQANSAIATSKGTASTLTGTISGDSALNSTGPGTLILTGSNNYQSGTTISGGTLQLGDGGDHGSIIGDVADNGTLAFNRKDTVIFGGTISGSGAVSQLGSGTTILTAANTFTGLTTIKNGTLQLGNGGTAGSIGGNVLNDGTLAFNRSDDVTFSGVIGGSGSVIQQGAGTTALTAANYYSGGTKIQAGTLSISNDAALGDSSGAVTLAGGTLALTANVVSDRAIDIAAPEGTIITSAGTASLLKGAISGSGSLISNGLAADGASSGTLILAGDNTYQGGTTVASGTLLLGMGGTTGSIVGDVTDNGTLAFNRSDTVTFDGVISGSGSLRQLGSGTTILTAGNTYAGQTSVDAGTLVIGNTAGTQAALSGGGGVQINAAGTLGGYGTVTGSVTNLGTIAVADALSTLTGGGNFTIDGDLNNSGLIRLAGTSPGNTLTVTGNYVGNNGIVALNTALGTDGSASDELILRGGIASGSTRLSVHNVGGEGSYTTGNGIQVVLAENGARTSSGNFSLSTPVVAGPYEYTLYRGSADNSSSDSWYLRSTQPSGTPNYRSEVSLYASLAPTALEYGRSLVDSLHQRVGEQQPWQSQNSDDMPLSKNRVWGRYIGGNGTRAGSDQGIYGDEGPHYDYQFNGMQVGADLLRRQREDGHRDMAGLTVAVGDATTTVDHYDGSDAGKGQLRGYSLGGYWTHYGPRNWYVDSGLMFTRYHMQADSNRGLPQMKTNGWGMTANVESGYPFHLNQEWVLEPQAQLTYQWVDINSLNDGAANVRFNNVQSLVGRLGMRLGRDWTTGTGPKARSFSAWGRLSVLHEALGTPTTEFSSDAGYLPFHSNIRGSWTQILFGVSGQASDNMTLYASGGYQQSFAGASQQGWSGRVGLNWQW